jgi:hypothetical protein
MQGEILLESSHRFGRDVPGQGGEKSFKARHLG